MDLKDTYGRNHNYLRISLTDKCNLKCLYCMPDDICYLPNDQLLTKEEVLEIAGVFVHDFGVQKIRLTGGEPLMRKDAEEILKGLAHLPVTLAITSNGVLMEKYIDLFQEIGLNSVNLSMDSLLEDRFKRITKKPAVHKVKENAQLLLEKGFSLKINMVVIRDINEDEIIDFVNLTRDFPLHVRFIEFMPFQGNNWEPKGVVSYKEIIEKIHEAHLIEKLHDVPNSTSKSYRVKDYQGTFSVISSITSPFCDSCNRLRVTADGKFRNCLFAKEEIDLLSTLRRKEDIRPLIMKAVREKTYMHGGIAEIATNKFISEQISSRNMTHLGG